MKDLYFKKKKKFNLKKTDKKKQKQTADRFLHYINSTTHNARICNDLYYQRQIIIHIAINNTMQAYETSPACMTYIFCHASRLKKKH